MPKTRSDKYFREISNNNGAHAKRDSEKRWKRKRQRIFEGSSSQRWRLAPIQLLFDVFLDFTGYHVVQGQSRSDHRGRRNGELDSS